jgi:hypothetical protein
MRKLAALQRRKWRRFFVVRFFVSYTCGKRPVHWQYCQSHLRLKIGLPASNQQPFIRSCALLHFFWSPKCLRLRKAS